MNARAIVSYFLGHYHVQTHTPFLINDDLVRAITSFINPQENETVLVLNPGPGPVARELAQTCNVIAVEGEEELAFALRHDLPDSIKLIHKNPLKIELPDADKFFANHATKDLILSLISKHERGAMICSAGIARKLCSQPGDRQYGRSAVIAQHYASLLLGPRISPIEFLPQARGVQQLLFSERIRGRDEGFEDFVTNLFRHKRKKTPLGKRPGNLTPKEYEELYAND